MFCLSVGGAFLLEIHCVSVSYSDGNQRMSFYVAFNISKRSKGHSKNRLCKKASFYIVCKVFHF